jgi:hypothetical protein
MELPLQLRRAIAEGRLGRTFLADAYINQRLSGQANSAL